MRNKTQKKISQKKLSLEGKSVLVTGGTGFVGSHLVDRLILEKPSKIIVVDKNVKKKLSNLSDALRKFTQLNIIQLDVSNFSGLGKLFKKYKISVVFHLAALSLFESLSKPRKVVLANVRMTTNLLELQRKKLFETLILISSSEAYGTAIHIPMREDHLLHPTTPYAASKAASDLIALSYYRTFDNDLGVVRPFNQYGPRHNPVFKGIVTSTIEALLSDRKPVIYGTGGQTRDYIFVKDTAKGILASYKHPETRGRIINLGSGKMIKMKDLVNKLINISGKKVRIKFKERRVADVKNHCADISLARKIMGWYPKVSLDEGLKKTYEWYKKRKEN